MHFSDLRVYKVSIELIEKLDQLISKIPNKNKISEIDQIKRSSSSVPANIAEGFGKKQYPKDYIRFLTIAIGSSDETQSHIIVMHRKKYINKEDFDYFTNQYKNLSIKILNLIVSIKKNHKIR